MLEKSHSLGTEKMLKQVSALSTMAKKTKQNLLDLFVIREYETITARHDTKHNTTCYLNTTAPLNCYKFLPVV